MNESPLGKLDLSLLDVEGTQAIERPQAGL